MGRRTVNNRTKASQPSQAVSKAGSKTDRITTKKQSLEGFKTAKVEEMKKALQVILKESATETPPNVVVADVKPPIVVKVRRISGIRAKRSAKKILDVEGSAKRPKRSPSKSETKGSGRPIHSGKQSKDSSSPATAPRKKTNLPRAGEFAQATRPQGAALTYTGAMVLTEGIKKVGQTQQLYSSLSRAVDDPNGVLRYKAIPYLLYLADCRASGYTTPWSFDSEETLLEVSDIHNRMMEQAMQDCHLYKVDFRLCADLFGKLSLLQGDPLLRLHLRAQLLEQAFTTGPLQPIGFKWRTLADGFQRLLSEFVDVHFDKLGDLWMMQVPPTSLAIKVVEPYIKLVNRHLNKEQQQNSLIHMIDLSVARRKSHNLIFLWIQLHLQMPDNQKRRQLSKRIIAVLERAWKPPVPDPTLIRDRHIHYIRWMAVEDLTQKVLGRTKTTTVIQAEESQQEENADETEGNTEDDGKETPDETVFLSDNLEHVEVQKYLKACIDIFHCYQACSKVNSIDNIVAHMTIPSIPKFIEANTASAFGLNATERRRRHVALKDAIEIMFMMAHPSVLGANSIVLRDVREDILKGLNLWPEDLGFADDETVRKFATALFAFRLHHGEVEHPVIITRLWSDAKFVSMLEKVRAPVVQKSKRQEYAELLQDVYFRMAHDWRPHTGALRKFGGQPINKATLQYLSEAIRALHRERASEECKYSQTSEDLLRQGLRYILPNEQLKAIKNVTLQADEHGYVLNSFLNGQKVPGVEPLSERSPSVESV
eukprot:Clim_evm31s242 gene=Clim_evmTU31s242